MATVTALVHTKNSALTLDSCLKSLRFADEILVVDMESKDTTRAVAKKHGTHFLEHKDVGYVEPARQFGLAHVTSDWTLIVDADEEVPETLAKKLQGIIADPNAADAYFLPRKNIVFEKWIEHTGWWPDYQFRFFKSGTVSWPAEIHSQPKISGRIAELTPSAEFALLHHNYQTIEQFVDRMNRYTTIEVDRGQNSTSTSSKHHHSINKIPTEFSNEFARRFFSGEGFLDGGHGLALSYLQSMYQVIVELKHWQNAGFPENRDSVKLVKNVRKSLQDLQYWTTSYHIQRSTGIQQLIWMVKRKFRW